MKRNIAVGYFDGVHLGHQAVLREAVGYSEKNGGIPAVVTFDMSGVRSAEKDPSDILPINERINIMKRYGISEVVVLPFEEIITMSGKDFAENILFESCNGAAVFTGEDFRFGADRRCGTDDLTSFCKQCGMASYIVPDMIIDGERVSSSRIRKHLSSGDIMTANRLTGRKYGFSLPVRHDKHLARRLGFPTANQQFPENIVVPRKGVYCSETELDGIVYKGISNLGIRPTVGGNRITLETHILDFSGDLYGRDVKVDLLSFIRDEVKFDSIEQLTEAIRSDIDKVRHLNI